MFIAVVRVFSWLGKCCLYLSYCLRHAVTPPFNRRESRRIWVMVVYGMIARSGEASSLTQPHKHCLLSLEFDVPVPSPIFPDSCSFFPARFRIYGVQATRRCR